jgi:hypothetical protein
MAIQNKSMSKFSFVGDLIFKNGSTIHDCEVAGSVADNGSVEGVINTRQFHGPEILGQSPFEIYGKLEDGAEVAINDARRGGWTLENDHCSLKFRARSLHETRQGTVGNLHMAFWYELTNLEFAGNEITETQKNGHVILKKDRLRFLCDDYMCELKQLEDYDSLIKELRDRSGSGVTSTLTITSLGGQSLDETKTDDFADAVCELLSLATKNTVRWVRRTNCDAARNETRSVTRKVGRLSSFQSGWSLIPDFASMGDGTARCELAYFLGSVTPRYVRQLRAQGLGLAVAWILDSEHQPTIDMKYIASFIAIERLRTSFLNRATVTCTIATDWNERISQGLGDRILNVVEATVGTLNEQQRRVIISKIRSANSLPVALELEALCGQLRVVGFDKEMGELRSKLVHTGGYGDFEFPETINLYQKLSHIVDVCVLRLLAFDGFYHHWATGWRPTPLKEHSAPSAQ